MRPIASGSSRYCKVLADLGQPQLIALSQKKQHLESAVDTLDQSLCGLRGSLSPLAAREFVNYDSAASGDQVGTKPPRESIRR